MAVERSNGFARGATVLSFAGRDGVDYFLVVNDPLCVPQDIYQILNTGSTPLEQIPGVVKLTREQCSDFK
jgi:hypothetical protein